MPYEYSAAQLRFLKKKFAKEREEETCCDCPGCEKCTGFIRNCTCDHDLSWLQLRHGKETGRLDTGQQGRIESSRIDPPTHVDTAAFKEYGF